MQAGIQYWHSKCKMKLDIQNRNITSKFLFELLSTLFLSINAKYFYQQIDYDSPVRFSRNLPGRLSAKSHMTLNYNFGIILTYKQIRHIPLSLHLLKLNSQTLDHKMWSIGLT